MEKEKPNLKNERNSDTQNVAATQNADVTENITVAQNTEVAENTDIITDTSITAEHTEEKNNSLPNTDESEKNKTQPYFKKISFALKTVSSFLALILVFSVTVRILLSQDGNCAAAEFLHRYFIRYSQAFFGKITSFIPFSLAETLILLSPLAAVIFIISTVKKIIKKDRCGAIKNFLLYFNIAAFFVFTYILNLSINYCRPSLSSLSGISNQKAEKEEICLAATKEIYELSLLLKTEKIKFDSNGSSVCPYGFNDLDRKIEEEFNKYSANNKWLSPYGARSKIISVSDHMTYTHISGIYTAFTGETNININYPDYITVATIAHEKAHQRGIAPEDEANVVAFLVLSQSSDPYLAYCGYMSVFSELMNACVSEASDFYYNYLYNAIPQEIFGELKAYSSFFKKYSDSKASKAADAVNDTSLKLNGEKEGVKSYGMVTDMAVSFLISELRLRTD